MEVANLKIRYSADVQKAIDGLHKADMAAHKSAAVAAKESKKVEGFLGKLKMGWVMVGAAAIAGLYTLAKTSAVLGSYLTEFGLVVGTFFDTMWLSVSDVGDKIIDKMWDIESSFENAPKPVQQFTAGLVSLAIVIPTVVTALAVLKWALTTLGLSASLSTAAIIGSTMLAGAAIAGFLVIYYTNWKGTRDKVNAAIDSMRDKLSETSPVIGNILASIAKYPGMLFRGKMILDPEQTIRTLDAVAKAIDNSRIVHAFRDIFTRIKSDAIEHYNELITFWKDLLESTKRIWNSIGDAIWTPIKEAYEKVRYYVQMISDKIKSIPAVGKYIPETRPSVPSPVSTIQEVTETPPRVPTSVSTVQEAAETRPRGLARLLGWIRRVRKYQYGGYVPRTGLAMLHAGEYVVPAGKTGTFNKVTNLHFNPTIYITGEMKSDTDLRDIAHKISTMVRDEVRRVIR